jgi:5-methylcytosine-specific restriction endonuclease McrA
MAEQRESSSKRGYGSRWQKAREAFLRAHPLCADHLKRGQVVQASVVDHVTPHRGDKQLFWDSTNWQSLCKHCHDSHKQRLEKSGKDAGCDLAGKPTDPAHHWNREGG